MTLNVLSYRDAAVDWEKHGLPIGNGRLGAMVLAAPGRVRLVFNVDSLWTGGENPTGEFDHDGFGAYQAFGTLELELDQPPAEESRFERWLDLGRAVHEQSWDGKQGGHYSIETFASHPAEVLALRLTAQGDSTASGRILLTGAHAEATRATSDSLSFEGTLNNGLSYAACLGVRTEDGALQSDSTSIVFDTTRELTLYLAAATTYAMDRKAGWRDEVALRSIERAILSAARLGFREVKRAHQEDHAALFDRVSVDFGRTSDSTQRRPTDVRIAEYRGAADPELVANLFQYGRYLLIASSRDNGLPANLQGLWNESNEPPWHSDYHTNINVQMNYWLAEPAHLPECHLPFFNLLDATVPVCAEATRAAFGDDVPGFCYRTSLNVFGGQGWEWNATANAWNAMHYWDHYAFGLDEVFLRQRAWPYVEAVARYWLARLKELDDGRLVVPDGWSPEHGPREDGVTYDQHLVWELFGITERAGAVLGVSNELLERVHDARSRLVEPRVGRWGQLMEWMQDRDDPNDHHRHTSHLIGVFPGTRIDSGATPEFAKAARIALEARGETGDSRRSWTWPWRCALWARLGTTKGHRMIDGLVEHNLLPNLITTHPPLQLDGNFGITAAICEMLLQSHTGEIRCLPGVDLALWPEGSFCGLRARGGFEVGASWRPGSVTVELSSKRGGPVTIRAPYSNASVEDLENAGPVVLNTTKTGVVLETLRGHTYRLVFR